jgi:carboxymethylenebutenolidase
MEIYPMRDNPTDRSVQVPNGALLIDAYLALPKIAQPQVPRANRPGIVVIQEVFGVNAHMRSVCDRLAAEGYVAIAPAMFQRTAPGLDLGYSDGELALGRSHKDRLQADQVLGDIAATIDWLRREQGVGAIGCIGFCFGGHLAFLGATLAEVAATALFYPSGIAVLCPGGGAPSLSRLDQIRGPVWGFFGDVDPLIPEDQVRQIEAELARVGADRSIDHRLFRYAGVGHGFFCEQRPSYDAEAAAAAWQKVKELFGQL